jgi:hypothetical protein
MGPNPSGLDTFDHVVVLMLENRSFDNVLGYLYQDGVPAGKNFEGVVGKGLTNPDANGNLVSVSAGTDFGKPIMNAIVELYTGQISQRWACDSQTPRMRRHFSIALRLFVIQLASVGAAMKLNRLVPAIAGCSLFALALALDISGVITS